MAKRLLPLDLTLGIEYSQRGLWTLCGMRIFHYQWLPRVFMNIPHSAHRAVQGIFLKA
jgi:hypothetical protein